MKSNFRSSYIFIFVFAVGMIIFVFGYKVFLKSVYPIKYENIVNESCKMYNIEPELIYAMIKSESGFDEKAESPVGARGLMQITPDTFEWLKIYTNDKDLNIEELFNPEVNIRYGTLFISILRKRYYSDEIILCAYNAGMSTVDRWLKDGKVSNGGEELIFIPYKETREYVSRIKESKEMYKYLYF